MQLILVGFHFCTLMLHVCTRVCIGQIMNEIEVSYLNRLTK